MGRLGTILRYAPSVAPDALVILFSDGTGWTPALDRAAKSIAADGAIVAGVDLKTYLANLAASDDGCHYLDSELEDLSKRWQRDLAMTSYSSPVLAGIGEGGTLAYGALAQAPAATVGGAVSVDPTPILHTRVPLCPGAPSSPVEGGGFRYGSNPKLPGWWRIVAPATGLEPWLRDLAAGSQGVIVGAGREDAAERLATVVREQLDARAAAAGGDRQRAIHPIELPAARPSPFLAVIYSGDGGWRDLDKQIGEILVTEGINVVGIDSLRYFWRKKTPEQIAADLSWMLRHYHEQWGSEEVALIGYSFGADILPFAVNRLDAEARAMVVQVSLLGLSTRALFQFSVAELVGLDSSGASAPILPELERLDPKILQCFYGAEEDDSLCPAPELAAAEVIRTAGGHHFDGNYAALARKIVDGLRRRAGFVPSNATH